MDCNLVWNHIPAEVKVLVLLSMTQSSGLIHSRFFFKEGKGGCHWSKVSVKETSQVATKTIKLSRDKSMGHLSYWPIDVEDFFNVKFALANYSIVYCSDEGLTLKCQPFNSLQWPILRFQLILNGKLLANKKKGWLIHLNGTWPYNYIFYLVESAGSG